MLWLQRALDRDERSAKRARPVSVAAPPAEAFARWAAAQLGLTAEADARQAILQRLPKQDFLPPPGWTQAYRILAEQPCDDWSMQLREEQRLRQEIEEFLPPTRWLMAYRMRTNATRAPDVELEEESRLRGKLETFEATYFALAPAERRRQWQELSEECAWCPPLNARLRQLQHGLRIDVDSTGLGEEIDHLVRQIQSWFAMKFPARCAKRRAFVYGLKIRELEKLVGLARKALTLRPELRNLDPELFAALETRYRSFTPFPLYVELMLALVLIGVVVGWNFGWCAGLSLLLLEAFLFLWVRRLTLLRFQRKQRAARARRHFP